jgi:hypothetical protein
VVALDLEEKAATVGSERGRRQWLIDGDEEGKEAAALAGTEWGRQSQH